jgi:spore maturation protein CgeB
LALFQKLKENAYNVRFETGPAYEDARDIYWNSKCGINWSSLQDTTARCFELMALGVAPILNEVPDLQALFRSGEDYLGFTTVEEAYELVRKMVADPDACDLAGYRARQAVLPHTWDARVETILKTAGVLA